VYICFDKQITRIMSWIKSVITVFWMQCILYADDLILLSNSLTATRAMFDICEKFAVNSDVKFNSLKSTVTRIVDISMLNVHH